MLEVLCKEMLHMAVLGVEFSFDGKIYKQIDGVAMGALLGPVLANIFIGYQGSKLFLKCKSYFMYL